MWHLIFGILVVAAFIWLDNRYQERREARNELRRRRARGDNLDLLGEDEEIVQFCAALTQRQSEEA